MPKLYHYQFMFLPNGFKYKGAQKFDSEQAFLVDLNRWNQAPYWKYWATSTVGEVVKDVG